MASQKATPSKHEQEEKAIAHIVDLRRQMREQRREHIREWKKYLDSFIAETEGGTSTMYDLPLEIKETRVRDQMTLHEGMEGKTTADFQKRKAALGFPRRPFVPSGILVFIPNALLYRDVEKDWEEEAQKQQKAKHTWHEEKTSKEKEEEEEERQARFSRTGRILVPASEEDMANIDVESASECSSDSEFAPECGSGYASSDDDDLFELQSLEEESADVLSDKITEQGVTDEGEWMYVVTTADMNVFFGKKNRDSMVTRKIDTYDRFYELANRFVVHHDNPLFQQVVDKVARNATHCDIHPKTHSLCLYTMVGFSHVISTAWEDTDGKYTAEDISDMNQENAESSEPVSPEEEEEEAEEDENAGDSAQTTDWMDSVGKFDATEKAKLWKRVVSRSQCEDGVKLQIRRQAKRMAAKMLRRLVRQHAVSECKTSMSAFVTSANTALSAWCDSDSQSSNEEEEEEEEEDTSRDLEASRRHKRVFEEDQERHMLHESASLSPPTKRPNNNTM